MEIDALRSFVVLAEHLHFGRAAQALHLSQPALSKQIQRLEREIGARLFERGTHGAALSAVGVEWLPQARDVLGRFDRMLEQGRRASAGEQGNLRIGFGFHTLELVPRLMVELRAAAPGLHITLRDMSSAEQETALQARELDLGFLRLPLAQPQDYHVLPVITDRLALVLPTPSPYDRLTTLADLRDQPVVTISNERSPGFYQHMLTLCAEHGFHPRIVQSVLEFTTAMGLVRAGMGVTFMPESFWTGTIPGLRLHRLPQKTAAWSVGAVWRRSDENPALRRFLTALRKELAAIPSARRTTR